MAAIIDHVACGIVLLDADGTVTFANKAAERIVGGALELRRGRLVCHRPGNQRALDALIASALPRSPVAPNPSLAIPRPDGGMPLLVQCIPIRPATADRIERVTLGAGGAMLLVHDLAATAAAPVERHLVQLGQTLELTPIASRYFPRA
jgi:PAS domain-containing protein